MFNLYTIYDHRFNLLLVSPEIKDYFLSFLWIQDHKITHIHVHAVNENHGIYALWSFLF